MARAAAKKTSTRGKKAAVAEKTDRKSRLANARSKRGAKAVVEDDEDLGEEAVVKKTRAKRGSKVAAAKKPRTTRKPRAAKAPAVKKPRAKRGSKVAAASATPAKRTRRSRKSAAVADVLEFTPENFPVDTRFLYHNSVQQASDNLGDLSEATVLEWSDDNTYVLIAQASPIKQRRWLNTTSDQFIAAVKILDAPVKKRTRRTKAA